ncbi:hypothetical protein SBA7_840022 [Candidatus Sulfotelmatobacter sp. SbA7]|nr:hypothetical protein SBA7_840022 [Candidatus Sulfotelmatobacter sp. SbA7]
MAANSHKPARIQLFVCECLNTCVLDGKSGFSLFLSERIDVPRLAILLVGVSRNRVVTTLRLVVPRDKPLDQLFLGQGFPSDYRTRDGRMAHV